ncbi:hypothetical protein [Corynebacterium uterequi]|uniref:Uncharacterized protein n=1 Tax=Corynebacterium uterequi TaxID=1072256 RepID=A0A0G3HE90_9CORY|nr:hypothetical protein [Corynebacterium uterequi]AKK10273.1 hypothetical protein CUTER_01265 [Corynebacterium uterequi]
MSMFPTPVTGGDDPNRRWRDTTPDGVRPQSLVAGYVLALAGAVLMVVSSLVMFSVGFVGGDAPLEVIDSFERNQRIVAVGNLVLAAVVVWSASATTRGRKAARRVLGAAIFSGVFLNLLGFIVTVSGLAAIVIVALLAFAAVAVTRPSANKYIRYCEDQRLRRSMTN